MKIFCLTDCSELKIVSNSFELFSQHIRFQYLITGKIKLVVVAFVMYLELLSWNFGCVLYVLVQSLMFFFSISSICQDNNTRCRLQLVFLQPVLIFVIWFLTCQCLKNSGFFCTNCLQNTEGMTVSYCCSFLVLYTLEEKHDANGKVVYKSRKVLHKVLESVCTYTCAQYACLCYDFLFTFLETKTFLYFVWTCLSLLI